MFSRITRSNSKVFIVPLKITTRDGTTHEHEYRVTARDNEHALKRAIILAEIDRSNYSTEDKSFGLIHNTKWWHFWRLRSYERGVTKAFVNGGFATGSFLGRAVSRALVSTNSALNQEGDNYEIHDLQRLLKNIIVAFGWYGSMLIVSLYLLAKGLFGADKSYIIIPYIDPFVISGTFLLCISLILLTRCYVDFIAVGKRISAMKSGGDNGSTAH